MCKKHQEKSTITWTPAHVKNMKTFNDHGNNMADRVAAGEWHEDYDPALNVWGLPAGYTCNYISHLLPHWHLTTQGILFLNKVTPHINTILLNDYLSERRERTSKDLTVSSLTLSPITTAKTITCHEASLQRIVFERAMRDLVIRNSDSILNPSKSYDMLYCSCTKGFCNLQHHISKHCQCVRIVSKVNEITQKVRETQRKIQYRFHPIVTLLINMAHEDDGDCIWRSTLNAAQLDTLQTHVEQNMSSKDTNKVVKVIKVILEIYVEGAIEISRITGEIFNEQFPPADRPSAIIVRPQKKYCSIKPNRFNIVPTEVKIAKALENNSLITEHFGNNSANPTTSSSDGNLSNKFVGKSQATHRTQGKTKVSKVQLNKLMLINNSKIDKGNNHIIWPPKGEIDKAKSRFSPPYSVELPELNPRSIDPACQITPRSPKISKPKTNKNHENYNVFNNATGAKGRKSSLSGRVDSPAYQATRIGLNSSPNLSISNTSLPLSSPSTISSCVNLVIPNIPPQHSQLSTPPADTTTEVAIASLQLETITPTLVPGNKWNDAYKRCNNNLTAVMPRISLYEPTVDNTPSTELFDIFKPRKLNATIKRHMPPTAVLSRPSVSSSTTTLSAQPKTKPKSTREAGIAPSSPPEGIG
jgi:hypothetical protein